jgi:hypothetical protein
MSYVFGGGHNCLRAPHLPTVLTVLTVSHVSTQTDIKITYRDFLQPEIYYQKYRVIKNLCAPDDYNTESNK